MILFSAISVATASDAIDNATISSIAEDQVIIESTDTEEDVLADTPDTFTKLDNIIQGNSSGSTITLDRNYTYVSSDNKVNGIVIDKDLTIDGAGYTLDGANMASIFKITGGSHVILTNINFVNGQGSDGGALSWTADDNVEIINSHFANNSASNRGGAIYVASGDAMTLKSAISASTFTNNRAANGGAIYVSGNLPSITSSNFSYNDAGANGGSIFLDVGAYIQNCLFDHESAAGDGGAIYLNSVVSDVLSIPSSVLEKLGVFDSTLKFCSAGNDGGAGYINANAGTVKNTTFMHNTAGNDGGAGYVNGSRGTLTNCTFINNTASNNGGAVIWTGVNGTIYDVNVINNTATNGDGGGIYLHPSDDLSAFSGISIVNCSTFYHNIAGSNGGAIYCGGLFTIMRNSEFSYDEAYDGAGIYLDVGAAIANCNFFKESAIHDGGAIYLYANNSDVSGVSASLLNMFLQYVGVRHSTITNCSAGHDGGAGYVHGDRGMVNNVTMTNNYAGHDGGAGYVDGDMGQLINSSFINNRAGNDGGALMWVGDNGYAYNITGKLNMAVGGNGGSVYVSGTNSSITKSDFTLSNATNDGGALYVAGDHVNITNSNFTRCGANTGDGGCIYISGLDALIKDSSFSQNKVTGDESRGGSILVEGNDAKIINCDFERCTAYEGGVIYVKGSNVQINDSSSTKTSALNHGGAIYVAGSDVVINNFTTSLSNATSNGGAIYVEGDETQILGSDFRQTTALLGAGIYVSGDGVVIDNSIFKNNNATGPYFGDFGGAGGSIYVEGDDTVISNSEFEAVHAHNYGGAIYVDGDNTNITTNTFDKCDLSKFNGGAIFVKGLNTTIEKSNFTQNRVNISNWAHGGSIEIDGDNTTIRDSIFMQCSAYEGGVIYVLGDNAIIDNATITQSMAAHDGGAIYVAGDNVTITNSNITKNNATSFGGAIYVAGNNTNITNNEFSKCIVEVYHGGAIYVEGLNTTIDKSNFTMCNASGEWARGGAIDVEGKGTNITNCLFDMCHATDLGGAIYVYGNEVVIDENSFNRSSANRGGAIYILGHSALISNSNISYSNSTVSGGGIYVDGYFSNITNVNLSYCFAITSHGGAIYVAGASATITNSDFNLTRALNGNGGAIYVSGIHADILNSTFDRCGAINGGVIYVVGLDADISGNFTNSNSRKDGGVLYIVGEDCRVFDSTFKDNVAGDDGGAIYWQGNGGSIDNIICINNKGPAVGSPTDEDVSSSKGGTICLTGSNITVSKSVFNQSYAGVDGGAMFITGNNINVTDSQFSDCHVNETRLSPENNHYGGALHIIGNDTYVNNCTFDNCSAPYEGGTIYVVGNGVIIANSTITNSTAVDGGAIYIEGDNATVSANISDCVAVTADSHLLGLNYYYKDTLDNTLSEIDAMIASLSKIHTENITAQNITDLNNTLQLIKDATKSIMTVNGINSTKITLTLSLLNQLNETLTKINATLSKEEYENFTSSLFTGIEDVEVNLTSILAVESSTEIPQSVLENVDAMIDYLDTLKSKISAQNMTYLNDTLHAIRNATLNIPNGVSYNSTSINLTLTLLDELDKNLTGITITPRSLLNPLKTNITSAEAKLNNLSNITKKYLTVPISYGSGGAIYVSGDGALINGSTVTRTLAYYGGAAYISGHNATIDRSDFYNINATEDGGALYISGDEGKLYNSNFTSNTAGDDGGAIYWTGDNGTVVNIVCSYNKGISFNESSSRGGAVSLIGSDVTISKSKFSFNNVTYREGSNFTKIDGGALFITGNNVNITDTEFSHNNASHYGGTFYILGNETFVKNCTIDTSNAINGGAIYIEGNNATISANVKNSNASDESLNLVGNGGAIYISGNFTDITESTFEECYAKNGGNGGAIYIGGINATVEKSDFHKTGTLEGYGGAIFIDGNHANILDSKVNDSYVGTLPDWELDSQGSIVGFTPSVARDGGAIYVKSVNATIDNVTIISAYATRDGGAIYVEGNNSNISATIINCTSGVSKSDVPLNTNDYLSNLNNISDNLNEISLFINNFGSVSIYNLTELLTYLNNAKNKVSSIFTSNQFNPTNFGYVNNTVKYFNSTLQSFAGTGFYNDLVPYLQAIESDLKNISEDKSYTTFNNVLKVNLTNNFDKMINYVTYYRDIITWLPVLQDNVGVIRTETDYKVLHPVLTDSKSISNNFNDRIGKLKAYDNAFASISDNINVVRSEFDNIDNMVNRAFDGGIKGDGGAIYVHGVNTNIFDSSFENCSSLNGGNGGAIYIGGVNATVNGSDFENCYAVDGGNGGAIYIGGVNAAVDESNFHKTGTVEGYGGAIYIDGNNAVVAHSNFNESFVGRYTDLENNITGIGRNGGAIYVKSENAIIDNVTIMSANATNHGGAIYVEGNDANISAIIDNCTAGAPNINVQSHSNYYLSHVEVMSDNVNVMYDFFSDYGPNQYNPVNSMYNNLNSAKNNVKNIFDGNKQFSQTAFNNVINQLNSFNSTLQTYRNTDFYKLLYPYLEVVMADLNNISVNKNYTEFDSILKNKITNNIEYMRVFTDNYKSIVNDLSNLKNNIVKLEGETDYNTLSKAISDCTSEANNIKSKLNNLINYDGSFIEISNNIVILSSEIETVKSIINTYNNGFRGSGGGIYVAGDNTYIHDSEISYCLANETAGGVYLGKNTTVMDSSFVNNTARYGGAMYNGGSGSRVFYSSFIDNVATYGDNSRHCGGAIYWIGGSDDDIIDGCYFEGNNAPATGSLGGALFWNKGANYGKGLINNSIFKSNYAARHGGALDWFQSDGGAINNCTFIDNYVKTSDGGAVYCGDSNGNGKNFNITNSVFVNNTAVQFGGGISSQMTNAYIFNCTFIGNIASYGGSIGIKDKQGKGAKIIACKIYNSTACGVNGGTGGGAIYISVNDVLVEDCIIVNSNSYDNKGQTVGGAICWKQADSGANLRGKNGIVRNVTIINGTGSDGGGIYWNAPDGTLDGVKIYNSTATNRGGGIYWEGSNGKLHNSTLENNTALNGGGIYWAGTTPDLKNNTFTANHAKNLGGGIYWATKSDLDNVTVKNNTAVNGGGIYWAITDNHKLTNSILMYNKAFKGSAIFTPNSMEIINSILLANRANSDSLTLTATRGPGDQSIDVIVAFKGNDNIINAIWNDGASAVVAFTNVTYLGVNGTLSNTGSSRRTPTKLAANVMPSDNNTLYQTQYEDYQNITYYIYDNQNNLLKIDSTRTNISGVATFSYLNTSVTDKLHVWVFHPLDDYYTYIEASYSKRLVYVEIPTTDIYYLQNETFIINVVPVDGAAPTPTGNVTVWFENEIIHRNITLEGGKSFKINITDLPVGTYTVNVSYTGDDEYLPRVNSTTFRVMKINSFIIPTVVNYTYGQSGKVIIHIPVNEPNNVTININGQDHEVKIDGSGYGELDIPKLGHGNYTIYAYYPETHNYLSSRNSTILEIYPVYSVLINKTVNVTGNISAGDLVNFTIELYNNGSVNATKLNVTDLLPHYFHYISSGSNSTYVGSYTTLPDGRELVIWDIGKLEKDTKLTLWLVVKVLVNGTFTNVANVNATQGENASNPVTINSTPVVDISIAKEVNVTTGYVNVTDLIKYTITVTNNGPCNATVINVTEILTKRLKVIEGGITVTNGTYDIDKGSWIIDYLSNGTSETLTIIAQVVLDGVISNTVSVTSAERDRNMSNNNASAKNITARPLVDLNITKHVNVTVANVSDLVNFTITIINHGPSNATQIYVFDTWDSIHLEYVSYNATKGSYDNRFKLWRISNINVNETVILNITARIIKQGIIPNEVVVDCHENDTNESNNIARCEFEALPVADISINKTVNVTRVNVTDRILYTIYVHNNGPCDAHGVYVGEVLDSHLRIISNYTETGSYADGTWNIGYLANGTTVNLTIVAEVKSAGIIPNSVDAFSFENDTNKSNNHYDCEDVTAFAIVDLAINKTVNVIVANVTDTIIYNITVKNNGPCDAHGVNVTEVLSSNLRLKDNQTWIGYYNVTTGIWYIGNLAVNESVELIIYAEITKNGTISNFVRVTSIENDTNKSNNYYDCDNVTALPIVDLAITKTASARDVNVSDLITFYITVKNYGPSNATQVNVTEVLDSRLRLVDNVTDAGYYNLKGGYWYIGDLANGTAATLNITAKVVSSGYFENKVEVKSFENETYRYNNTAWVPVSAWDIFDLQINKTVDVKVANVTDRITYTIIVKNNGPCNATYVSVIEILDSHLKIVDNITDTGHYNGYSWVIGNLTNGTSVNLTIIAEVIKEGIISNFVNVTGAGIDTNKSNDNYTCENVTAYPIVDLQINKTVNVKVANVTDVIIYTITVKNNGPSKATGVNVTEVLSSNLKLKDNQTWIGYYNVTDGVWYIGNLSVNESVQLVIYAEVIKNGTISNVVSIISNENDTNRSNNNYTCDNITALPIVDLSITKTASAHTVNVTDIITFYITVKNNGPCNATQVSVTEILDSHLRLVDNVTDVGYYNKTAGKWYIGDLAKGTSVTMNITAEIVKSGYFENLVEVRSFENDTYIYNNTSVVGISAWDIFDLEVNKTVDVKVVNVTDRITYTIIVKNNGPCNATYVSVIEILDSHLRIVDNITDTGYYNGYAWIIGNLANGSSVNLTIVAEVVKNGTIANEVILQYAGIDTNKSNDNYTCENVTAYPIVDLAIKKTVNVTLVNVSDSIKFTITLVNNGPSTATGINVTEILSEYVQLVKNETQHGYYDGTIWHIEKLEKGETATLELILKVIGNGTITNTVNALSNENDTNMSNNNFTCDNVTALPIVDLNIKKTVNATLVNVSDIIRFSITVHNNGPSNATDIKVTERLSDLLEIIPNGIHASIGNYDASTGLWTIEILTNGSTATLTIEAKVTANGTISNAVTITSHENDTNRSNNNFTCDNVTALPIVDLNATKSINVTGLVNVSDYVEFTITVRNEGPSNATNVEINDKLIDILDIKKFTVTPGKLVGYDFEEGIWYINQISPNETVVLTIVAQVINTGVISNTVSVTSDENDTNKSNNNASSPDVQVFAVVDLSINKTVNATMTNVTDLIEFTITVTNHGPNDATGVNVTEIIDSHLKLVKNETRYGYYDGTVWHIPRLANGTTATLTLVAEVISAGNIQNAVNVTSNENDTNRSNNHASSDNITAFEIVDLKITKTVNTTKALLGDIVEYVIDLTNNGPSNATGVSVLDKLDSRLELVSFESSRAGITYDTQTGEIYVGNLSAGEVIKFTVIARVVSLGNIENIVNVTSNENDTNRSNNHASSDNITAFVIVDLKITKTVNATEAAWGDILEYVITLTNNGPSNATGVSVLDKLDSHLKFISFDSSRVGITYDTQTGEIYVGDMSAGEVIKFTVIARVVSLGNIENIVNVTSNENDTNKSNNHASSDNVTASRLDSPIVLDCYDITYGEDEMITVTLPATGTVNITVGDKHYDNIPIDNGIVKLPLTDLAGGDYDVTVVYGGNEKYSPNSTSGKFKVSPITPVITIEVADIWVGEVEILNVTVNAPGFVNITVNGVTVTIPLENGVLTTGVLAAVKNSYLGNATWNIAGLPVGTYPALAVYLGNENYTSVSASDIFHVMDKPTTVVVTADDIHVGEDAVISIQVGPKGLGGNVTVTLEGKTYIVEIDEDGKATLIVSGLKSGLKKVTVRYNGTIPYRPSENSTTFNVLKLKPTIDVFDPEINLGEDGVITVKVPIDATGTITIEIEGRRFTAPIKDGEARFVVPGLKAGEHKIKIFYSGDGKYLPANATGTIKVNPDKKPEIHNRTSREKVGLEVHETGNPIIVLFVIIIGVGLNSLRRFRK